MTIKVNTIDRQLSEDGKADVCKTVHYTATQERTVGKYDDIKKYTASSAGAVSLPSPSEGFIEYENLTEIKVVEWIKDLLGKDALERMEESLNLNINEQIAPTKAQGKPW